MREEPKFQHSSLDYWCFDDPLSSAKYPAKNSPNSIKSSATQKFLLREINTALLLGKTHEPLQLGTCTEDLFPVIPLMHKIMRQE